MSYALCQILLLLFVSVDQKPISLALVMIYTETGHSLSRQLLSEIARGYFLSEVLSLEC